MNIKSFLATAAFWMLTFRVFGNYVTVHLDTMPRVMMIGENESAFDRLSIEYQFQLISACNDDPNAAFEVWKTLVKDIESYSNLVNYDLKGMQIWLQIFCEGDGSIKHIAFYPKPNSRNVQTKDLKNFFYGFSRNYKLSIAPGRKFSHYGSAAFPTLPIQLTEH